MKIALHAEHALMSAPLKQFLRVKSTRLIRMYAPIVAPAPMCARLKQFTLNNRFTEGSSGAQQKTRSDVAGFFYWDYCFYLAKLIALVSRITVILI